MDVIIKKSKISGKGVFAGRDYKKGEVVLRWKPKPIRKSDISKLSKKELAYVVEIGKKYSVMQSPERYSNHSCEPNTKAKNNCDVAVRNIKKGEEITSNYSGQIFNEAMQCKCGSPKCKKLIK